MILFKHGFQSKILPTVNSICTLDFENLARNYGALLLNDGIL